MTDDAILALAVEVLQRRAASVAAPRASAATVHALSKRWWAAHGDLASLGSERGRAAQLLMWQAKDGPFAGVRLARRDPMSLSPEDIDMFRADQRKRVTKRKRPTSAAWRNRAVMLLQRWLNFAASRRTIPSNPIKGLGQEREDPASSIVITEESFALIMDGLGSELMRAWAVVAFESGMRRGEMLKLCWRQLDAHAGVIRIPAEHTKAKKARDVEYPRRSREALEALPRVLGCPNVFANPDTKKPYNGRWIHELFVRGVAASGVVGPEGKPPTLHRLRVAYVTLFCDRGTPETVVMNFSGHTDPSVFLRYRIVRKEARAVAMKSNADGREAEIQELAERRRAKAGDC